MKGYTEILKGLREDNDKTQKDIAKILNCTQTAYGKWENGKRQITIDKLITLAKYYNVSLDYIAGLTQDPTPNWTDEKVMPPMKNNTIENILNGNTGSIGNITIEQK